MLEALDKRRNKIDLDEALAEFENVLDNDQMKKRERHLIVRAKKYEKHLVRKESMVHYCLKLDIFPIKCYLFVIFHK